MAEAIEFDDVSFSISMIVSGIDPQTKKFTEPPEQIKKEIAALKADKTIPEAEKKQDLAELEAALKAQSPFSSRKTSRWCLSTSTSSCRLCRSLAAVDAASLARVSAGARHNRNCREC
jgi:hypothetical protein